MPFTHTYSTTFSRPGESSTGSASFTSTGEINLNKDVAANGTATFDVDYLPSKLKSIFIKGTGSFTLQAKNAGGTNLGPATVVTSSSTTVLGTTVTNAQFYWFTGSNTGPQPLCDTANLSTAVASILASDSSGAANTVSITILYEAA